MAATFGAVAGKAKSQSADKLSTADTFEAIANVHGQSLSAADRERLSPTDGVPSTAGPAARALGDGQVATRGQQRTTGTAGADVDRDRKNFGRAARGYAAKKLLGE